MDIAVQSLALGLEALEDALRDGDELPVLFTLWLDAAAAQVRGARLDVADRELQLLQPAEGALAGLVRLARDARLALRALLVGALELLDLLAQAPDVTPQPVDDEVIKTIKVVLARKLRRRTLVDSRTLGHVDQDKGVG
ncbi:MAG TPA: hypothetical protein VGS17_10995 [Candidatus Limnocylindria bacterium]|nr:hypothetical protein [Candidatus Limnocylindria bacterium]